LCQRIAIIKKGQIQGLWDIKDIKGQVENTYLQVIGITQNDYQNQKTSIQKLATETQDADNINTNSQIEDNQ